jgi:hypothetical protein
MVAPGGSTVRLSGCLPLVEEQHSSLHVLKRAAALKVRFVALASQYFLMGSSFKVAIKLLLAFYESCDTV